MNPDGTIVAVVMNQSETSENFWFTKIVFGIQFCVSLSIRYAIQFISVVWVSSRPYIKREIFSTK